jgi:uncharacterized protein YabN with tetrapyrrole methylase and pyrophosphatase domain
LQAHQSFQKLLTLIARLRDPRRGCPWVLRQTHASLRACLLEEAREAARVISHEKSAPARMKDELGDLLLVVLLHAHIAEADGVFSLSDLLRHLNQKIVRRHPHVFPGADGRRTERHMVSWREIKRRERAEAAKTRLGDKAARIPRGAP